MARQRAGTVADVAASCAAMKRRVPVVEIGVALAAVASAVLLVGMLASPLLPVATPSPLPTAPPVTPAPSDAAIPLPMGLYQSRDPLNLGPCVAIDLGPESYVAVGDEGAATVYFWDRGMTGCDARTGEVRTVDSAVEAALAEGGPSAGEVIAYTLKFTVSLTGGADVPGELAILLSETPNPQVLQALDVSAEGGGGIVLDRVEEVDPRDDPIPTAAPTATPFTGLGPIGLYRLRGPLDEDGPCLAVDLAAEAYPAAGKVGRTTISWWQPAAAVEGAAACVNPETVDVVDAVVIADAGPGRQLSDPPTSYVIRFSIAAIDDDAETAIAILVEESTADQLHAVIVTMPNAPDLIFDRVDGP